METMPDTIPAEVLENHNRIFRERLKQVLEEYDLTGKDTSKAIHSNPSSFSRMLRGKQESTENMIIGLTLYLGCSADWLLGFSDDRYEVDWEEGEFRQALWRAYQRATEEEQNRVQVLLGMTPSAKPGGG